MTQSNGVEPPETSTPKAPAEETKEWQGLFPDAPVWVRATMMGLVFAILTSFVMRIVRWFGWPVHIAVFIWIYSYGTFLFYRGLRYYKQTGEVWVPRESRYRKLVDWFSFGLFAAILLIESSTLAWIAVGIFSLIAVVDFLRSLRDLP